MIIKSFEINEKIVKKYRIFAIYGENEGLKKELITIIKNSFEGTIFTYEEAEILKNKEEFNNNIKNKSLFDEKKIFIINRCTEKLLENVIEITKSTLNDIVIVINFGLLEKKSKIRNFFEKSKDSIIVPTYKDTPQTLINISKKFFLDKKISISQETINLLINRCIGDRGKLKTELEKISNYLIGKKTISLKEIYVLTNLSENYSAADLVDSSLCKNQKKTCEILNENSYVQEDCFLILRIFLQKTKKILDLLERLEVENDLDTVINSSKPPIFWKDKPIVKKQLQIWTAQKLKELIYKINNIEVNIKKNNSLSVILMQNFIFELVDT